MLPIRPPGLVDDEDESPAVRGGFAAAAVVTDLDDMCLADRSRPLSTQLITLTTAPPCPLEKVRKHCWMTLLIAPRRPANARDTTFRFCR